MNRLCVFITQIIFQISIIFSTTILLFLSSIQGYTQACTSAGANLVTNGSFESCTGTCTTTPTRLDTEFPDYSPDYSTVDCNGGGPTHAMGGGKYAITSNAGNCFSGWWGGLGSSASNTAHGGSYAMLIDGSGASTTDAWCQNVSVTAGTKYQFIAWLNNPWNNNTDVGSNGPEDLPSIRLTINGNPISSLVATPTVFGGWDALNCVYTMQASDISGGTTQICIQFLSNGSTTGNDLLIDDISFTSISSCPSGTCGYTGVTLPVNLLSFEAKEVDSKVLVQWTTTSEENVSEFFIEKSTDGTNFVSLGSLKAIAPYYSATQNYQFYDDHFSKSAYYRLKTADIDGKTYLSNIEIVKKTGDRVILIRTTSGELEVKAIVSAGVNWQMGLYTLLGQEIKNKIVTLNEGENILLKSAGNENPQILRVTSEEGEVIFSEVIVW